MQGSRKTGALIMLRHVRQNAVVVILKILIAAKLLGHGAAESVCRIGFIIQFCGRSPKAQCDLPDDQLRRGIAGVGVLRRLQIGAVRIPVGQRQRQQILLFHRKLLVLISIHIVAGADIFCRIREQDAVFNTETIDIVLTVYPF